MNVLLFVGLAMLPGAAIWYAYYRKKQRRLALAAFASRYGLQYTRDDPFGLLELDFHLFDMGDRRGCENVVFGAWEGLPVREADYWYYTTSTDANGNRHRSYRYLSVVVADLAADMPNVSVQREGLFGALADRLGFHDIDFESEGFNKEFQIKAEDRGFAYKLIDARMIQWLLSTGGEFGFEVSGSSALVWRRRLRPTELISLMGAAKLFHDHIPRLVWNEYGTGSARPKA